jgi:hypothetical protein
MALRLIPNAFCHQNVNKLNISLFLLFFALAAYGQQQEWIAIIQIKQCYKKWHYKISSQNFTFIHKIGG